MNKPTTDAFNVLIVDDSEDDRFLMRQSLQTTPRLQVKAEVDDGEKAISYLRGQSKFRDRHTFPLPHLMLLDLKMPVRDGFEVLEWLRTQRFKKLVVVVLTDSMGPAHIKRALDLGADRFQVKPSSEHERHAMMLALEDYLIMYFNNPFPPAPKKHDDTVRIATSLPIVR